MKKDNQGRITNLMKADQVHEGHSVCVSCGKDMPICWDTVCFICGSTFCYDCSSTYRSHWYCKKHRKQVLDAENELELPVIEITKDKLQEILDLEGYTITVDELIQMWKEKGDDHAKKI